jgi:hypothetical protein
MRLSWNEIRALCCAIRRGIEGRPVREMREPDPPDTSTARPSTACSIREIDSDTLSTLQKAAIVIGREVCLDLMEDRASF